jgi:hypothetical protein
MKGKTIHVKLYLTFSVALYIPKTKVDEQN